MYTYIGVSTRQGQVKVRYANDNIARVKRLQSAGDTNIIFVELPHEMDREAAIQFGSQLEQFASQPDAKAAFEVAIGKKSPAPKVAKTKAAKSPKKIKTVTKLAPKVVIDDTDAQVEEMLQMLTKLDYKVA